MKNLMTIPNFAGAWPKSWIPRSIIRRVAGWSWSTVASRSGSSCESWRSNDAESCGCAQEAAKKGGDGV